MNERERWRPVIGYENDYVVSSHGRVRYKNGDLLPLYISPTCYISTTLSKSYTPTKRVHRLVAAVFCKGYDESLEVNHIDGCPFNNHYTNLEWVTHRQNAIHRGKMIKFRNNQVAVNKLPMDVKLKLIKELHTAESHIAISRQFDIPLRLVRHIHMTEVINDWFIAI